MCVVLALARAHGGSGAGRFAWTREGRTLRGTFPLFSSRISTCLPTYLYFAGHQAYAAYITSMHFFKHGVWQGVLLTMLASGELQS